MRFRIPYEVGQQLGWSAERADGAFLDFADGTFKAAPAIRTRALAEGTDLFAGRYSADHGPTPGAQFWDGPLVITIHDLAHRRTIVEFAVDFYHGVAQFSYPPFFCY
jgi:hypothetical protein